MPFGLSIARVRQNTRHHSLRYFSSPDGRSRRKTAIAADREPYLPQRVPDLWNAAFNGAPRKPDSPMGVVGAARVGGDVFSLHIPPVQRVATMLMLSGRSDCVGQ